MKTYYVRYGSLVTNDIVNKRLRITSQNFNSKIILNLKKDLVRKKLF